MNGARHHRREQFQAFKSAFEEAEKDRHGVTLSHKEGVDFGIVDLADAQRGVQKTVVLKTIVPSSRTRISDLKLHLASSRIRQASS
jgi:helicase MOV-10